MKKMLLGILVSIGFIGMIAYKFDYKQFAEIWTKINYFLIIPAFGLQIIGAIFSSIRWYYLLEKNIKLKHAISSSFIGYGANMVLPARGGDLFRVYYCRKESGLKSLNLLSKLFLEKIMDFILVIILGIICFSLHNLQKPSSKGTMAVFTISGLIVFGIFVTLYIIRFQNKFIVNILEFVGKKLNKEELLSHHLIPHVKDMGEFLKIKNLIKPLFYSSLMWTFYLLVHFVSAKMLQLDLNFLEIGFLVFCGGMSLALPSAPSGVGVYHASIISGFVLLSRTPGQGLQFATIQHLVTFIILSSTGLLFYLYWTYRRRHSKDDIQLEEE
ncbi:MAG: flippase-like domain-containing protein [Leptospiraceae bacterium]|nr:flippase-like domain-containing protein [Leptospiraceae bacterium]